MLGVLSSILGNADVIKKGMDLIDDVHTSDEEMERTKAQTKIETLKAYQPFKVAQRVLAFSFAGTYLLCFAIVLGMTLSGHGDPDQVTTVMDQFSINYAMLLILGFYFGGGAVEGLMDKRKK